MTCAAQQSIVPGSGYGQWVFSEAANDFLWFPEGHVQPFAPEGVRTFSPTEITKGFECLRLWGFEYLEGIKGAQSESARLGNEVHQQLERWLRFRILPDPNTKAGQIAEKGLHFWPAPQLIDPHMVEMQMVFLLGGFWFKGIQDVGFVEHTRRVLGDHKTTGDFKWAKTALDLRGRGEPVNGVQSNIYAAGQMLLTGVKELEARWVYYLTKKPYRARRVVEEDGSPVILTQESVVETFSNCILPKVRELSGYIEANNRLELSAWDLPPTTTRCDSYGGCPHRAYCNLDPVERLVGLMAQEESMADRLRAKIAAEGINPPPSTAQPQPLQQYAAPPGQPANNLQPSLPGYGGAPPPPPPAQTQFVQQPAPPAQPQQYAPPPPPPAYVQQPAQPPPPPAQQYAPPPAYVQPVATPPAQPPTPTTPDPLEGLAAASATSEQVEEGQFTVTNLLVCAEVEQAQACLTRALAHASSDKEVAIAVAEVRETIVSLSRRFETQVGR